VHLESSPITALDPEGTHPLLVSNYPLPPVQIVAAIPLFRSRIAFLKEEILLG